MFIEFTSYVVGGTVVVVIISGLALARKFFGSRNWDEISDGDKTYFIK